MTATVDTLRRARDSATRNSSRRVSKEPRNRQLNLTMRSMRRRRTVTGRHSMPVYLFLAETRPRSTEAENGIIRLINGSSFRFEGILICIAPDLFQRRPCARIFHSKNRRRENGVSANYVKMHKNKCKKKDRQRTTV